MRLACLFLGIVTVASLAQADDKWDINRIDTSKLPPVADKQGVTYAKDIRPLFEASCFHCHGKERHKGHLRLDSLQAVLKGGEDGKVIVPGNSRKSLLVAAASRIDSKIAMPPKPRGRRGFRGPPEFSGRGGPGRPPPPGGPGAGGPPPGARPGGFRGRGRFTPPKPLTKEQVSLIRAWVDQGAK